MSALDLRCPKCATAYLARDWFRKGAKCPTCGTDRPRPPRYVVGLDLGQAADYTAVAIVEQQPAEWRLRWLERYEIGTRYPTVVKRVAALLAREPLADNADLVVDQTGVGRPVVDMLRDADLAPICVTITAGDAVTRQPAGWHVPKRDLVSALVVPFQNGGLSIAPTLPLAPKLVAELLNFKMKINLRTGNETYEAWRESEHDDLVLATALAAWWLRRAEPAATTALGQTDLALGLPAFGAASVMDRYQQYQRLRAQMQAAKADPTPDDALDEAGVAVGGAVRTRPRRFPFGR